MKFKPKNIYERLIKMKESDKEIYLYLCNRMWLSGMYIGVFISFLIILFVN